MKSNPPPLLEAHGINKRFGDLVALEDVSFRLEPGSFHALLGENGAGKSTLVKCIMGFYQADAGTITIDGKPIAVKSPKDAQRFGIGMVYQHFTLVENMTVAENLVLSRASLPPVIHWKREIEAIERFMKEMPFQVPVRHRVRQLAAGEKQKLEILKQLYLGSKLVILDEPTSVLTPQEADEVLGMLGEMARAGQVSVAMITHRFREVTQFCDQVTVLRKGRYAGGGKSSEFSAEELATLMVGSTPPETRLERSVTSASAPVLEIEDLTAVDDLGLPVLKGVTVTARSGEIVGIAGVSGNGQDQLVEVLAGQRVPTGGAIRVGGRDYVPNRHHIRQRKVRLLPEAPLANACVSNMTVAENLAFRHFDRHPFTWLKWALRHGEFTKHARSKIKEYKIKTPSPDAPIGTLSGGNVQRAVLARELSDDVSLLIAANPCFGLDFAAVSEIRTRIMQARNSGTAVLLVSADLEEIFALADRIVVMSEGRLVYETPTEGADLRDIGRHMAGHH